MIGFMLHYPLLGVVMVMASPALDLYLIGDHLCGETVRYRSTNQANSAFHPLGVDK